MKHKSKLLLVLCAASVLGVVKISSAADSSTAYTGMPANATASNTGNQHNVPVTTETFLVKAVQDGLAEVELGKIAVQRGSSDRVKNFGQKMVDDHGKANTELAQIAAAKGVTLPQQMASRHKKLATRLSKLTGAGFDREYLRHQIKDHNRAIAMFSAMAQNGKDADLKSFATKTLPTLKDHQDAATHIAEQLRPRN